ncbi:hypothetical protein [Magnetospirillum aberrantis]|uniref:Uncharacterized protein n=1 Tax=Magnetospirillum aberrantis SpK TaxID=908842 RepID=A0A7C9V247_9PROT|nr:hypothetical protein [Magnetospirillum aberrantis]NFV82111.1 hypothetical protein [Magnetospirillum aberrantis SpK]
MFRVVAVNEAGLRCGEDHPGAKLTDSEVELIRQLRESGMSYGVLADKFDVSKSCIADICKYRRRGQFVLHEKKVRVQE